MELNQWLETDLQKDIWTKKYQYDNETLGEFFERVSGGNEYIKKLMIEKKFLPAGRILSNRGLNKSGRKVSYSNCYLITAPDDNVESIFECAKKLARTYSYGGGCGVDISKLSPRGAKINNAAKETTGSVSFMELFSTVTGLIGQLGRRGALMISLDCSHPDIEEFINVKNDLTKITKANISIKITDDFMQAVKENKKFTLKFTRLETGEEIVKEINAKDLFHKIAESNWKMAEPGTLFWDRIKSKNMLSNHPDFEFAGVNPCGELPLPAGGACLLASINLSEYVNLPFSSDSTFDFVQFNKDVKEIIKYMNEILDEGLTLHPLQEQKDSVKKWRQIGLGIMGLADMFIKLGIEYGSEKSIWFSHDVVSNLFDTSVYSSAMLAKETEPYPMYKKEYIIDNKFYKEKTSVSTKKIVEKYGLKNSQLLTCAPTGTISTMLGVSGGIEPIFNFSYTRKTESLHGKDEYYKVYTPIVEKYMKTNNIIDEKDLPDFFVNTTTLHYKDRINMQKVWQDHIDASISSTVNVPENFTIEEIEDLYMYAWQSGLKGITVYRDNCSRTGILTTDKDDKHIKEHMSEFPRGFIEEVPKDLNYRKYKIKSGCGYLYFFLGIDEFDGKIYDCFCNTDGASGCPINSQAVSRLLSAGLRGGVPVEYLARQLDKAGICPSFQYKRGKGEKLSPGKSCPSAIANVIKQVLKEFEDFETMPEAEHIPEVEISDNKDKCPECGEPVRHEGSCIQCSCGWSFCG